MVRRRRPEPAELRTVDLFTGLTPLEEAERLALEEDKYSHRNLHQGPPRTADDMIPDAFKSAVEWLGENEPIERGDNIRVAKGPKGSVVLVLIRGDLPSHPYSTINLRLSAKAWGQLKRLALEDNERPPFKVDDLPFPE